MTGTTAQRVHAAFVLGTLLASGPVVTPQAAACAPVTRSGGTGVVAVDLCAGSDDTIAAIAVDSNGVVVSGSTRTGSGPAKLVAVRFTHEGALDPSFNKTGVVVEDVGGDFTASGVAIDDNHDVVVSGTLRRAGAPAGALLAAKYTSDGALDKSFNHTGIAVTSMSMGSDDVSAGVAVGADKNVVLGGTTRPAANAAGAFAVAHFGNTGDLDIGYGENGKVITHVSSHSDENAGGVGGIDMTEGGAVVLAGTTRPGKDEPHQLAIVQYDEHGKLEKAFNGTGIVTSSARGLPVQGVVLAVQGDGSVVVAGAGADDIAIARFTPTGHRDAGFNRDNALTDIRGGKDEAAYVADDGGKVVLAGMTRAGDDNHRAVVVLRYDEHGQRETDFAGNGVAVTTLPAGNDFAATGVAVDADHGVVVGGTGRAGESRPGDLVVARYLSDGKPSPDFGAAALVSRSAK